MSRSVGGTGKRVKASRYFRTAGATESGRWIATLADACPEQTTSFGCGALVRCAHGSPRPQTLTSKVPAFEYACVGAGVDFPEVKGYPVSVPSPKSILEPSQVPVPSTW